MKKNWLGWKPKKNSRDNQNRYNGENRGITKYIKKTRGRNLPCWHFLFYKEGKNNYMRYKQLNLLSHVCKSHINQMLINIKSKLASRLSCNEFTKGKNSLFKRVENLITIGGQSGVGNWWTIQKRKKRQLCPEWVIHVVMLKRNRRKINS